VALAAYRLALVDLALDVTEEALGARRRIGRRKDGFLVDAARQQQEGADKQHR
jgi:hypothetical protein